MILIAAAEPTATRVADVFSDRETRTAETIASASDLLDDDPTAVLVATALPDGDGTDLLSAVRSGDRCDPATPVIRLVDPAVADSADTGTPAEADGHDAEPSSAVPVDSDTVAGSESDDTGTTFDEHVAIDDANALRETVGILDAVRKHEAALEEFYRLCRHRSADESVDDRTFDDARRTARERLLAVQRASGGRTPFDRLLAK